MDSVGQVKLKGLTDSGLRACLYNLNKKAPGMQPSAFGGFLKCVVFIDVGVEFAA